MQNKVEKVIKMLDKATLSLENRVALTTAILNKLNALPLSKSIIVDNGKIFVRGIELDREQEVNFREGIAVLQNNFVHKLFNEQLRYQAINLGINVATSMDTLMFSKAALWVLEQEIKLVESLTL